MALHLGSEALDAAKEAPLAGRAEELRALEDAFGRLDHGPIALELVGEPGIGKTRLLAELADRCEERNHLVLTGRAIELERDLPFAPFIDALGDHLTASGDRLVRGLTTEERLELGHIFPASFARAGGGAASLVTERFRTHLAMRSLLEALARAKPLVLCLDDLHWADDASVEAIDYLLRRPPRAPVLLALAFRPREAPDRLLAALAAARREGRCVSLQIGPLSRDDASPLLAAIPSTDARDTVFHESGGNPFYLEELVRIDARAIDARKSGPALTAGVPGAVSAALAVELEELSPPALALLRGAAVLGEPFEPELAAEVAEVGGDRWPQAVDELFESDFVRPTDAPRRLRFRHPIVRLAVYEATPHGWRLSAHARAARALARLGVPPLGRAHHVECSATAGDGEAISVLTDAARAAEPRAPASAAHWFRAALELLPEGDGRRLELLIPMATSLGSAGELNEGREALIEVLKLLPPEMDAERIRLIAFLAAIDHQLGLHDEARARNLAAHREVGTARSPASVASLIELAVDCVYSTGAWEEAVDWAHQALDQAQAVGEPALVAAALAICCVTEDGLGHTEAANQRMVEASAVLDGLTDEQVATRLDAPFHLGFQEFFLERYEASCVHLARGIEVSRASGQGQFIGAMQAGHAWALAYLGRLSEAEPIADAALEVARLQRSPQGLTWALWTKTWVRYAGGDLAEALRLGEESVATSADLEPSVVTGTARTHLAAVCVETGAAERALELLEQAGSPSFSLYVPGRRPVFAEIGIAALLELGRLDEAADWARLASAFVDAPQLPVADGIARRGDARVLLREGKPIAAAESALVAAEQQDRRGARIEAARSRLLAGQALALADDGDAAAAQLDQALAEFERCGSTHWAAAARQELRRLGRRVPPPGARAAGGTGLAALSDREREVAELVADGLTNREVAERLFISRKTVESHLARIFEKLGVSRRVQVGAAIERDRGR